MTLRIVDVTDDVFCLCLLLFVGVLVRSLLPAHPGTVESGS